MRMRHPSTGPACSRVLVGYTLANKSCRDHFAGVLRYVNEHTSWHVYIKDPTLGLTEADIAGPDGKGYDGYLISVPGSEGSMSAIARSGAPTVLVNITDLKVSARTNAVSFVWLDNADIGKRGAEHLVNAGRFASFGFVHDEPMAFYSYEREVAFRARLKSHGFASAAFPPKDAVSTDERALRQWIATLPKPAALMAATDVRAHAVVSCCRALGLSVPHQVAVVGVDNDDEHVASTELGISSVPPDFAGMGYRAAHELDLIMKAKGRRHPREVLIPALDVVTRESTRSSVAAETLVMRAEELIRDNVDSCLRPTDVAERLGCSRSLLELRFREQRGVTLRMAIEKARLDCVRRLLAAGNVSVAQLARRLRFTSPNQLSRIFKRHFGVCMRECKVTTEAPWCDFLK